AVPPLLAKSASRRCFVVPQSPMFGLRLFLFSQINSVIKQIHSRQARQNVDGVEVGYRLTAGGCPKCVAKLRLFPGFEKLFAIFLKKICTTKFFVIPLPHQLNH
ncbi:MAG: hypothetical protein K2O33_04390, partial [Muribaculaceae bacterium]|nr:hypothetical protein [Muribaculaceae bacterium]